MFSQDAATFLADLGEPLCWTPSAGGATVTGLAIFDQADAGEEGGGHLSREYALTLETATWLGLKRGEVVTQGSGSTAGNYKLRTDLVQQDDGVFSTVKVSKVAA